MVKGILKWLDKKKENFTKKFSKEILGKRPIEMDLYDCDFSESFIKRKLESERKG